MTGTESTDTGDEQPLNSNESLPTKSEPFAETCSIAAEGLCSQCGALLSNIGDENATCHQCGGLSVAMSAAETNTGELRQLVPERFTLKGVIGEGAFGVVYRAWDTRLQRNVALKMPKRTLTSRHLLAREARAAAHLRHMNIVRIFDVIETADTVFIVSDFIDGPSLARYRLERTLDIPTACQLAITIARAMEYAHNQGVIHRDLKPSNIVIDKDGEPHVVDFGLSRSRSQADGSLVRRGHPIGTPAFMSPEQAAGEIDKIGVTSDVYSLGIILFQLLANHLPFSGDSDEVLHAVLHRTHPSIRSFRKDVPPALSAVIDKALAKDSQVRYQSANEFAEDLQAFLDGKLLSAYQKPDGRVLRRWMRISFLPLSAMGLLVALFFVFRALRVEQVKNLGELAIGVETLPAEAATTWQRLDPVTGRLESEIHEVQGGEVASLKPGFYKVRARQDGLRAEVFRTVPGETDVRINGVGIPYLHRNWEGEPSGPEELKAIPIELRLPNPLDDAIHVRGGKLVIGNGPEIGLLHHNINVEVGSFWITAKELGLADIKAVFPNYSEPGVSYEIAATYAEKVGASLPTVEEYLYIDAQGIDLEGLRDGLSEWTESPQPRMALSEDGVQASPADLRSRLVLKSFDPVLYPDIFAAPLTHTSYFSPTFSLLFEFNSGFRLVWRE